MLVILDAGGNIPDGFDLSPLDGQVPQGVIPVNINGETQFVPFLQDGNDDFDVTATAEQFVALGFTADGDTDMPNEEFSNKKVENKVKIKLKKLNPIQGSYD